MRSIKYPTDENIMQEQMLKLEVKRTVRKAKNDYINKHISGELDLGNSKPLFNQKN